MPGVVTAVAAPMLDPVSCTGMATIGAPRVTVSALLELHHLLVERGKPSLNGPAGSPNTPQDRLYFRQIYSLQRHRQMCAFRSNVIGRVIA
jgi:hypothetical protein